jgi:L-threonylcarbamoyladenylate synthase
MPDDLVTPAWRDGHVEPAAITQAHRALAAGGVVGLPTETVYGLAAVATDRAAVARVFGIKGRPTDHPVIVHVAGPADLRVWGSDVADHAVRLAEALWPGPLTLVVPAAEQVPRYLTGGQDTVGLRCPAHPVALAVIEAAGAVAAPSANRFGQVSPTTAADVVADIGDRLDPDRDLVLDGGACPVGVESTILDCTADAPRVLRWGAVEIGEIERVGGRAVSGDPSVVRAPGGLASHYAPRAAVRLGGDAAEGDGFLAPASVPTPAGAVRLARPADTRAYAAVVYRALRDADTLGLSTVWAQPPADDSALAKAVRDRLSRAAVR